MQIILLFIAQKWLAVFLPACMLFVYFAQKAYLRKSRQLRFLELESRAGIFSSFLESVGINPPLQSATDLNFPGWGSRDNTVVWLVWSSNTGKHPMCRQLPTAGISPFVSPEVAQYRPRSLGCSCCNKCCCYSCSISRACQRCTSGNCAQYHACSQHDIAKTCRELDYARDFSWCHCSLKNAREDDSVWGWKDLELGARWIVAIQRTCPIQEHPCILRVRSLQEACLIEN